MITDRENTFFDNLLPAASATPFGDVLKITNRQRNPDLVAYLQAEVAVNNATSLRFQFVSSAAADLSTPNVIYDTGVVALAAFNSAQRFVAPVVAVPEAHQYLGWIYTLAGTAPTLGGITGGIAETATLESLPRPAYWTGR